MDVLHAVYRNKSYDPTGIGIQNMDWQHFYINVQDKSFLRKTGTYTLNPVTWALNRPSHEAYGRGIVSQMLIEILTANFMGKDILIASQAGARPPMLMTSALQHKLDLRAGATTFVSHKETQGMKMGDLVTRLIDSSSYPFGIDNHMRWQQYIDERFGVPLFLAMNSAGTPEKTAYEIRQRQAERATLMAPFLGTLGVTTDREFDRIYSIEAQAGRAPEPPDEVLEDQNNRVDIDYIGPLAQLLKMYYETGELLATIENIRAVLEVSPESAVVYDGDVLMRKILRTSNAPEELILSEEEVNDVRAIAQQQAEQQRMAEMVAKGSEAIPNLSGKIEQDSMLSAMKENMVA
jgi:hypothetical protein